jgi:dipeptidyl aminopeptidase/acylaminoacyl peptidase
VAESVTVLRWRGEISAVAPLVGGRLIAVVAGDELTDDDERRRAEHDDAMAWSERAVRQHWRWHRLRLLDLKSGQLTVVAELAGRHVVDLAQRPDGGPLAVLSWDCPEYDPGDFTSRLHIVDVDAGTATDLGNPGHEVQSPVWWQGGDGWHIAWLTIVPPSGGAAVLDVAVPPDGTADETTDDADATDYAEVTGPADLTAAMTACPAELVQVSGGPRLALFAEGLDTALYRLDPTTRSFRRVTGWPGQAVALSASDDGTAIAVLASTAYAPPDVAAGPPGELARLSDTRPELRRVALGAQERRSRRAPDGLELDGILILPPGRSRADGPFPLVTIVHGGPYGRWPDELMAAWWSWGQWLAAAGFAVFHPNPRGSQGHGRAFAAAVAGAVGQEEWTDILAGLDDLVADGLADPARLGIAGWSHGGFMAAWAVTGRGRLRRQLRLGRPRPAPPRPAQPDLARRAGDNPGADPARRRRQQRPGRPGNVLPPGAHAVRRRARPGGLPAREPRVHRASPPDRRPGTRPLLVHPLAGRSTSRRKPRCPARPRGLGSRAAAQRGVTDLERRRDVHSSSGASGVWPITVPVAPLPRRGMTHDFRISFTVHRARAHGRRPGQLRRAHDPHPVP